MIKKLIASSFIVVAFALYVFISHQNNSNADTTTSRSTPPAATTASTTASPQPSAATNAQYKDGQYTGDVADAFYGNLQVQATISGGQLTDVTFLQYPNDRRTSIEVNSEAMPLLKQEAIKAQSGQVDIVTGATDSSMAFIESLSSALAQAKS